MSYLNVLQLIYSLTNLLLTRLYSQSMKSQFMSIWATLIIITLINYHIFPMGGVQLDDEMKEKKKGHHLPSLDFEISYFLFNIIYYHVLWLEYFGSIWYVGNTEGNLDVLFMNLFPCNSRNFWYCSQRFFFFITSDRLILGFI